MFLAATPPNGGATLPYASTHPSFNHAGTSPHTRAMAMIILNDAQQPAMQRRCAYLVTFQNRAHARAEPP